MKHAIRDVVGIPALEAVGPPRGRAELCQLLYPAALRAASVRDGRGRQLRSAVVPAHVDRVRQYLKIFRNVVQSVVVLVVDHFAPFQRPTKNRPHDVTVFENHFAVDANLSVAVARDMALPVPSLRFCSAISLPESVMRSAVRFCVMGFLALWNGAASLDLAFSWLRLSAFPLSIVSLAVRPSAVKSYASRDGALAAYVSRLDLGRAVALPTRVVREAVRLSLLRFFTSLDGTWSSHAPHYITFVLEPQHREA
jgi:hypothetical protein